VLFAATEDWYFSSHYLPFAKAACEAGYEVVVVTRVRDHRAAIEATGARLVPLQVERRHMGPLAIGEAVSRMTAILRSERPDLVHAIALRAILVAGAAARRAGVRRKVLAVTGLGFLGARRDLFGKAARLGVRLVLRGPLDGKGTRFLFQNRHDPRRLGLDPDDASKVTIIGGAGVDPTAYPVRPMPEGPTLRVAFVGRMLWSKGADVAVEAVRRARRAGADVTLTLVGDPDPGNPRAVPESELRAWAQEPFVTWVGRSRDIAGVWAAHHVALLPSRGGEGLPRTLLEAAACGRAVVTTDVPGCHDFVRDAVDGLLTPTDDPEASARHLVRLAANRRLVQELGAAASARVTEAFTENHALRSVRSLWEGLLAAD
jgi:glycosyltransferase involved in cell wall biosynthesis